MPDRPPIAELIVELAEQLGQPAFTSMCVDLLGGAPRERYLDELPGLTGHSWAPGDSVRDPGTWGDYWVRSWGARGLLHVWHDSATRAIVLGLDDEHYRPAEMCLKVAARHDVAGTGDGAARLATHELPRVRAQAARCLAVVGDTEHGPVVEALLDDTDPLVRQHASRAWKLLRERLDL
ncbi:MAG: HEAT repeat domain-containing protein [Nocardioides sp.]